MYCFVESCDSVDIITTGIFELLELLNIVFPCAFRDPQSPKEEALEMRTLITISAETTSIESLQGVFCHHYLGCIPDTLTWESPSTAGSRTWNVDAFSLGKQLSVGGLEYLQKT